MLELVNWNEDNLGFSPCTKFTSLNSYGLRSTELLKSEKEEVLHTRMPFVTTSISLDMAFWNPILNNTQSPPKSFPCLSLSLRNISGMSEYIFLILSDIRLKLSLVKIST